MARKKNKKTLNAVVEPIVDPAYRDHYEAQLRFNDFANLNVKLDLTGNVTSQTTENYVPSEAVLVIERPEINKKFTLSGSFTEEPIGPTPVEGKSVFIYAKNASDQWVNAAGEVSERPVALAMPTVPVNKDSVLTVPTVTGYVVDTSVNPVDFGGAEVGSWVGDALHVTITDDTNLVLTYAQEV